MRDWALTQVGTARLRASLSSAGTPSAALLWGWGMRHGRLSDARIWTVAGFRGYVRKRGDIWGAIEPRNTRLVVPDPTVSFYAVMPARLHRKLATIHASDKKSHWFALFLKAPREVCLLQ